MVAAMVADLTDLVRTAHLRDLCFVFTVNPDVSKVPIVSDNQSLPSPAI